MDKKSIEEEYHRAVSELNNARSDEEQTEARKKIARLEHAAMQRYGFDYVTQIAMNELRNKCEG